MNRAKFLRMMVATLAFLCTWTLVSSSVRAETETWEIKSSYRYQVQIQFFSKDRNAVWPAGGEAFLLDDSKMHEFTLNCRAGERICYGAWDVARGNQQGKRYWGVGPNNTEACSDCCWTCGRKGAPRSINLTR